MHNEINSIILLSNGKLKETKNPRVNCILSTVDLLQSQFLVFSSFGFKGHTGLLGNKQVDTVWVQNVKYFSRDHFNDLLLYCIYYKKQFRSIRQQWHFA